MYYKGKWCTAGGKDPLFGHVDGFQIGPKIFKKDFNWSSVSVTFGDSSPRGRAEGLYFGTKNGAYRFRYAPFTVLRSPSRPLGDFSICQKVPTFIGRKQASFGRHKRRSFRCAAYRLLVNRAADYSLGPASTRALPASLPSYLTKFLTNRPARSLALVSHSSTLA